MALTFTVQAECGITKARAGLMKLPHCDVRTPVFMPVGTQVYNNYLKVYFFNVLVKNYTH